MWPMKMTVLTTVLVLSLVVGIVCADCDDKSQTQPGLLNTINNVLWTTFSKPPEIKVEPVTESSRVQKGLFWDATNKLVFFVDWIAKTVNTYNPKTNRHFTAQVVTNKTNLLSMTKIRGSSEHFLLNLDNSLAVVRWNGRSTAPLTPKFFLDVETQESGLRLNGVTPDLADGFFVASRGTPDQNVQWPDTGSMYHISCNGTVKKLLSPTQVPNGIDLSIGGDKLYYTESFKYQAYSLDYNAENLTVSNKKVILDWSEHNKANPNTVWSPDGAIVDAEDKLWIVNYGGGSILRINPQTGRPLQEVVIPGTLYPVGLQFGGDCLDTLFVTTAVINDTDAYQAEYPDGGSLFKVTGLGVRGRPSREVCLDKSIWQDVL